MKEILRKTLVTLLLIITIFNFIYSTNTVYASTDEWGAEEVINAISNSMGGIAAIVLWPLRIKIVAYSFVITEFITTSIAKADGGDEVAFVTPFHVFFNKLKLLDIDFFDFDNAGETGLQFRNKIAEWYYTMRAIAVAAMVIVLVYVGIMMAISTLADDKAKYKKMLTDWVMSIALLFLMQYIIIFIIELNGVLVRALETLVKELDLESFMLDLALNALIGISINSIVSALVYAGVCVFTLGFIISYINRMLKVGFLIIISPLITITYSIDKMKDNKSQALDAWLKEIIYTILIQPFHCIIYVSYISVCFELLITPGSSEGFGLATFIGGNPAEYNQLVNGVLAILCIAFIRQGEKIVRQIFGFKDDSTKTSLGAGLATTTMIMSKAKSAGATARKITNSVSNMKVMSKIKERTNAIIDNSPKLTDAKNKIVNSNGYNSVKTKLNAVNDNLQKAMDPLKKTINNVKDFAGAPKRFMSNLDQKLTDYAKNHGSTNRIKARLAAGTRNALAGIRKANSSATAAGLIAGMGNFVSQDGGLGKAFQANAATQDAVNTYMQGSTNQVMDNLEGSQTTEDQRSKMDMSKDPEISRLDAEYTQARADTKRAKAKYKSRPNARNEAAFRATQKREREVGDKLNKAKKDFKTQRKLETSREYNSILQNGKKGRYKKGSDDEKKLKGNVRDIIKGTIASDVQAGTLDSVSAARIEREALSKIDALMYSIEQNTGLNKDFDDAAIEQMLKSGLGGTLSQIPSFGAQATSMLTQLGDGVKAYRAHCDESFTFDQLSKFQAGGGDIDRLTDAMFDEVNE